MPYNPEIHHRRSIRLKNYDYSQQGVYFVTICTQDKRCVFGTIRYGEMQINTLGALVTEQWQALSERFPHIVLREHIVMPNHIHGIIQIVGATLAVAQQTVATSAENTTQKPKLGKIVGAYKSLCVKRCLDHIKQHKPEFILGKLWQRNYYEHIIRNEKSYYEIAEYIVNNPMKWAEDKLYAETSSISL